MTNKTIPGSSQTDAFLARPLGLELVVASVMLGLAYVWQAVRPVQLMSRLSWSFRWLPAGLLAAILPLLMIPLLESSAARRCVGLRGLRDNVDALLMPLFGNLGWFQVAMLAVLAGLSEEIFFRGVVQQEIGLLATSLAFGLLHPVSLPYVIWAAAVGLYLGLLVQMMHNLWPAIVAHMVIDFVGLCYLRLIVTPRAGRPNPSPDSC